MKKFRAVCLAFVMMLSVAVMLCGCGDTKITDKVNFFDVDEITVVMSDESTAVLGEVDFKTVKNILQSAETGGTSGEFDGGILIETRKGGIVTHNIRVGGADKICVEHEHLNVKRRIVWQHTDRVVIDLKSVICRFNCKRFVSVGNNPMQLSTGELVAELRICYVKVFKLFPRLQNAVAM